jgi:luciferase family oxidoreductase group 1
MTELPLSILDLAPVSEGTSTPDAVAETVRLAQEAEALGYTRVWYAEHHGMPSIASSSPDILIANTAARTSRIRVGSGGVMLPNHVPLRVVETFRTLAALHPGRIDLGIGRAGGSDGRTLSALRSFGGEAFPEQLSELMAFDEDGFPPGHPFKPVRVVPENVPLPPIWLLGSSGASAAAAGSLGMGYAFAAHFSPAPAGPAFEAYRAAFKPSAAFPQPHAILAVAALAAPTRAEAEYRSGSQALSWALFQTGQVRRLIPPDEAAVHVWTGAERAIAEKQGRLWIVGAAAEVRDAIATKAAEAGADEVIVTTTVWDYALRRRSYALLAQAFALSRAEPPAMPR